MCPQHSCRPGHAAGSGHPLCRVKGGTFSPQNNSEAGGRETIHDRAGACCVSTRIGPLVRTKTHLCIPVRSGCRLLQVMTAEHRCTDAPPCTNEAPVTSLGRNDVWLVAICLVNGVAHVLETNQAHTMGHLVGSKDIDVLMCYQKD